MPKFPVIFARLPKPPAPAGPEAWGDGQSRWFALALPALFELGVWVENAHGAADYAPVLTRHKRLDAQGAGSGALSTRLSGPAPTRSCSCVAQGECQASWLLDPAYYKIQ